MIETPPKSDGLKNSGEPDYNSDFWIKFQTGPQRFKASPWDNRNSGEETAKSTDRPPSIYGMAGDNYRTPALIEWIKGGRRYLIEVATGVGRIIDFLRLPTGSVEEIGIETEISANMSDAEFAAAIKYLSFYSDIRQSGLLEEILKKRPPIIKEDPVNLQEQLVERLTQPTQEWLTAFGEILHSLMDSEVQKAQAPELLWEFSAQDEVGLDLVPAPLQPLFRAGWERFKTRFRSAGYRTEIHFKSLSNPACELYFYSTANQLKNGTYKLRNIEIEGSELPLVLDINSGTLTVEAKEYSLDEEGLRELYKALVSAFGDETADEEEAEEKVNRSIKADNLERLLALNLLSTDKDAFLQLFNPEQMRVFESSRLQTDAEITDWQNAVQALLKQPQGSATIPYFGYGTVVHHTKIFTAQFSLSSGLSLAIKDVRGDGDNLEYFPLPVTREGVPRGWLIAEIHTRVSEDFPWHVTFVSGDAEKFDLERASVMGDTL